MRPGQSSIRKIKLKGGGMLARLVRSGHQEGLFTVWRRGYSR